MLTIDRVISRSAALMCDYLNYLLLARTDKHMIAATLRIPVHQRGNMLQKEGH